MLLHILRLLFLLVVVGVAMAYISGEAADAVMPTRREFFLALCIIGAALLIGLDLSIPRKTLGAISGLFFGLVVGLLAAYALSLVADLIVQVFAPAAEGTTIIGAVKVLIGVGCCYLAVSFILQTKDDIRFVIPYVEFSKQTKGARPLLLDTSVIIDGRIADICDTRIIESQIVVPRFILQELQGIADSSDRLKRNRGRRGLDMLNKLQTNDKIDISILDTPERGADTAESVDTRLVNLAAKMDGRVITNDYNLNKICQLRGVDVININDLANALKPVVLPGETMSVKVIKPGEEPGQGVGYLEDGTMVVVEQARDKINEVVSISVTSVLQTSAGRMIFGRPEGTPPPERRRRSHS